jgi:hypothetical protein
MPARVHFKKLSLALAGILEIHSKFRNSHAQIYGFAEPFWNVRVQTSDSARPTIRSQLEL